MSTSQTHRRVGVRTHHGGNFVSIVPSVHQQSVILRSGTDRSMLTLKSSLWGPSSRFPADVPTH